MKNNILKNFQATTLIASFLLLISCSNGEKSNKSSDNRTSNNLNTIDFLNYENGKVALQLDFKNKPYLNQLKSKKQYDINGNLLVKVEYEIDKENKGQIIENKTIFDLEGNIIIKKLKRNYSDKIVFLNQNIINNIDKFWTTDVKDFYKNFSLEEKVVKKFKNGDTRELVKYIITDKGNIPVERLIYETEDINNEINFLKEHHKLLGNERRLRTYKMNYSKPLTFPLESDEGFFSDDLKLHGFNFDENQFLIAFLDYEYDDEDRNNDIEKLNYYGSNISLYNYKNKISVIDGYSENNYFIKTSDKYFDIYRDYKSSYNFTTKKNLKWPLSQSRIPNNVTLPDEYLDNSINEIYDYDGLYGDEIYKEDIQTSLFYPAEVTKKTVYPRDSLNEGYLKKDKVLAYRYFKNKSGELLIPSDSTLIFKSFNLQNLKEKEIFAIYYHPSGSKRAEVSFEFNSGSWGNREKIIKYFDDKGNDIGTGRFSSGVDKYTDYDFIVPIEGFNSNTEMNLTSGVYYEFFYGWDEDFKIISGLTNPITKKVTKNELSRHTVEYSKEYEQIDYTLETLRSESNRNLWIPKLESLTKTREYSENDYGSKDGKEVIYGDNEIIIEEIIWKDGDIVKDF